MSKKVMITGSCGFVFSNYIIYLLQHTDWDIVSIDKLTSSSFIGNVVQNKRHKLYIGDICDYHFVQKVFEIEQPEIVIHGAAESFVDSSLTNSCPFMQSNVIGTHSMLEACLKGFMPKLFVNFETDEEYGEILSGSFKETDILRPRNPYSASKASADLIGQSYYTNFGVPVITTRCCNIFGPRQNKEKMIPKIISNILMDKPVPVYGEGKQIREWIYIKDVYLATQKIIECGKIGEIYNISSGHEETNIDLVNKIFDITSANKKLITFVPDRLGHDFRYSISANKLKLLGWDTKYNFNDALFHTIKWMTMNNWSWNR